jgi:chorismate synthase
MTDKLVDQINVANRNLARMTKSQRAKGKMQQRNLRLKSTLKRIGMRAMEEPVRGDAKIEAALKEALALACERIEDLETREEALVEELKKREDSAGGPLKAELAFRRVIDDKLSKGQKEHWEDLVEE